MPVVSGRREVIMTGFAPAPTDGDDDEEGLSPLGGGEGEAAAEGLLVPLVLVVDTGKGDGRRAPLVVGLGAVGEGDRDGLRR